MGREAWCLIITVLWSTQSSVTIPIDSYQSEKETKKNVHIQNTNLSKFYDDNYPFNNNG